MNSGAQIDTAADGQRTVVLSTAGLNRAGLSLDGRTLASVDVHDQDNRLALPSLSKRVSPLPEDFSLDVLDTTPSNRLAPGSGFAYCVQIQALRSSSTVMSLPSEIMSPIP
jgi:hypothetical protein